MQNSESGRKINQAVNNTSRAVGGALSQAKGAISYWWSSMTTAPPSTTGSTTSESRTSHSEDISVSFQNSGETIEEGISVHTEEKIIFSSKNVVSGGKENKSSGDGNCSNEEKPVDSAEELMEENQIDIKNVSGGIVEIAKEAELLNRDDQIKNTDSSNGNIFIV